MSEHHSTPRRRRTKSVPISEDLWLKLQVIAIAHGEQAGDVLDRLLGRLLDAPPGRAGPRALRRGAAEVEPDPGCG
jgi:hypothetical protein